MKPLSQSENQDEPKRTVLFLGALVLLTVSILLSVYVFQRSGIVWAILGSVLLWNTARLALALPFMLAQPQARSHLARAITLIASAFVGWWSGEIGEFLVCVVTVLAYRAIEGLVVSLVPFDTYGGVPVPPVVWLTCILVGFLLGASLNMLL